jgi:hypothetical protein
MKAKKHEAKEERRAARKIARLEPPAADDEPAEDQPTDTAGQAENGAEPQD